MNKMYSWSEAQQVIEFYEQLKELLSKGWVFQKQEDFQSVDPETGIVYMGPTLEILLQHNACSYETQVM
jgi:hypothetical protein